MTLTVAVLMTTLAAAVAQAPAPTTVPALPTTATAPRALSDSSDTLRQAPPAPPASATEARHRIEVRAGGWTDGWYGYETGWDGHDWGTTGQAQGAFGLEYLSFIRSDLGIGLGLSGLVNANGDWGGWDQSQKTQVTLAIPVVVRWYPVRRFTHARSIEPYVTAGIGPVFGVDTRYAGLGVRDWSHHRIASTHVATGAGGRFGGGVDFRLGTILTLGVAGAWNWDAGLPGDLWRGARPNGGEFTAVLGWMW